MNTDLCSRLVRRGTLNNAQGFSEILIKLFSMEAVRLKCLSMESVYMKITEFSNETS